MMGNNNPANKRLLTEYKELYHHPETEFVAAPCNDDLFLWHFTIKGQKGTPFEGGIYHGKIVFPAQYPLAPPDIYFLTPNGRFEINTKICFSITSFHPDTWNPAWDVRTALLSIIAFMPTKSFGAIGGIDETDEVRRKLAIQSRTWTCGECSLKIEPDDIPNLKNENDSSIDENMKTEEEANDEQLKAKRNDQENIIVKKEIIQEEDIDQPFKESGKMLPMNLCQANDSVENEMENNNINNDQTKENLEEFNEDLLNINIEELYSAPEIIPNYQENNNNNFSNTENIEEENQLQTTNCFDYETLLESAKSNKPFVFFPYLEIPIALIFYILMVFVYRFHSE